jgi:hypothetical protein
MHQKWDGLSRATQRLDVHSLSQSAYMALWVVLKLWARKNAVRVSKRSTNNSKCFVT